MADQAPITNIEEFEEEYRKGAGVMLPGRAAKQASLDNIRRAGDGIGDCNPLWRDEQHAAKSRFGMITAMPSFVYSTSLGVGAAIQGNIHPARTRDFAMNYAGGELEIYRPIWLGDTITCHEQVGPVVRKESGRIGPFCICTGLVSYFNQRHELVATKRTLMARYMILGGEPDHHLRPREQVRRRRRSRRTPLSGKSKDAAPSPATGRTSLRGMRCRH